MPFRSTKQRAFMHARHPEIAARWDKRYGGKIVPKRRKKRDHRGEVRALVTELRK
jgi:hypothetical protein